ncbi:MAG: S-ribosylhomocysteine lyase [Oscillospiraceae bacterium]
MQKIASFCVDHNKIVPGMYISRIDDDIITYDIRLIKPNTPPFLTNSEMHTIEHIFATFVRSSEFKNHIIYFGLMRCRTGFYLLTKNLPHDQVINLTCRAFEFIANFNGEIPGCSAKECGNFKEHDLESAKRASAKILNALKGWEPNMLKYPE